VLVLAALAPLLRPEAAGAAPHDVDVEELQDGYDIWTPADLVTTPDGAIWYEMFEVDRIGRLDPTTGEATVYGTNADGLNSPNSLQLLPDGHLWFTIATGVVDFDPATGDFDKYVDPDGVLEYPQGMTLGPDGNLWMVAGSTGAGNENVISRFDPVAHEFTNFTHQKLNGPEAIVVGPDGNLWFTNWGDFVVGRITTDGAFTFFPGPANIPGSWGIVSARGALWFTSPTADRIGRMTTDGAFSSWSTGGFTEPRGLYVGPDRHLWLTSSEEDVMGRFDLLSHAVTTLSADPGVFNALSSVMFDGSTVWVTVGAHNALGRFQLPSCDRRIGNVIRGYGDAATMQADVIIGTPAGETIKAIGGSDLVCAGGGADTIGGGAGDDILHGQRVGDTIRGGEGADFLDGGSGPGDHCDGGPARDRAEGCETAVNI
jgi:virginiamycin B lyase